MRIGIDARELGVGSTGVGRYLRGLMNEWATDGAAERHQFLVYAPEPAPPSGQWFQTRVVVGAGGTWWEQVTLPRAVGLDRLDVFFAPGYTAPLSLSVPTVVAIHDVSFFAHPEWFRWREGARRRWLTRWAAHKASAVITISNFSRREIVEHLGVPDERMRVIPPGVDALPVGETNSKITDGRVLFVGSIFNRRHVPDLIKAFGRLGSRRPDVSLDIVGDNRSYPRQEIPRAIAEERLDTRIRWHQYVSDAELGVLYAQARAFAFLSEYEGLGLTPLEALAAGVPPVLLDTPVARESCGDAALYVSVNNIAATEQALESALFDEPLRARMLGAAPAMLSKYGWPTAARETLGVLEKAAR
jgi:glycosyltransferase involved in cell wall biosynthesis